MCRYQDRVRCSAALWMIAAWWRCSSRPGVPAAPGRLHRETPVISGGGRLHGSGVGSGRREYVEEGERVVDVLG